MAVNVQKCAEKFGGLGENAYLCRMEDNGLYVITAISRLTGQREEISGPMDEQTAQQRLEREKEGRLRQRHLPWNHLKVETLSAVKKRRIVQLTINFDKNYYNE